MSPSVRELLDRAERFPRVSGDEPIHQRDAQAADSFSPRERG